MNKLRFTESAPGQATEVVKKSFTVELWSRFFDCLGKISLSRLVRWIVSKKFPSIKESYLFVDYWVLGNLLLSFILLSVLTAPNLPWYEVIFLTYAIFRVFEVIIYQINVLLFDEYRAKKKGQEYALRGYRRIVILVLNNYLEVMFWFALIYRNITWAFESNGVCLNSFFQSLNLSFVTMTTFGHTDIVPKNGLGGFLVLIQSAVGLFMALVVLARIIGLLPTPKTKDEFEK